VLTTRAEGRPVGFVILLRQGDMLYARMPGFDYDRCRQAFCYFNLCTMRRFGGLRLGVSVECSTAWVL
jgi:hypothetical protein